MHGLERRSQRKIDMEKTTFGLTLYGADCQGNARNSLYPHRYDIHSLEDFLKMADRDFVCAEYINNLTVIGKII